MPDTGKPKEPKVKNPWKNVGKGSRDRRAEKKKSAPAPKSPAPASPTPKKPSGPAYLKKSRERRMNQLDKVLNPSK
jgi:hypothetical protein